MHAHCTSNIFAGYGNIRLFNQRTLNTNNGDTLKLQCTNRDIKFIRNLRRLTWHKDGTRIQDADPRLNVISRNYLLIRQVREQDAGVYNCTVEAAIFLSINITDLRVIGEYSFSFSVFIINLVINFEEERVMKDHRVANSRLLRPVGRSFSAGGREGAISLGDGLNERRRCESLAGCGGMLSKEILKIWLSDTEFRMFWRQYDMQTGNR